MKNIHIAFRGVVRDEAIRVARLVASDDMTLSEAVCEVQETAQLKYGYQPFGYWFLHFQIKEMANANLIDETNKKFIKECREDKKALAIALKEATVKAEETLMDFKTLLGLAIQRIKDKVVLLKNNLGSWFKITKAKLVRIKNELVALKDELVQLYRTRAVVTTLLSLV